MSVHYGRKNKTRKVARLLTHHSQFTLEYPAHKASLDQKTNFDILCGELIASEQLLGNEGFAARQMMAYAVAELMKNKVE
jgi:hypothetical protein